jgi:CheY-like chemotaxis protein
MRVLLVEDDPTVAADLELLLPIEFEIVHAADSRRAIDALAAQPAPDAVVLDLNLPPSLVQDPDDEGLALLRFIRRELALDIPVIVLSSRPPVPFAARCQRLGANAYLEKPCRVTELVAHLTAARRI